MQPPFRVGAVQPFGSAAPAMEGSAFPYSLCVTSRPRPVTGRRVVAGQGLSFCMEMPLLLFLSWNEQTLPPPQSLLGLSSVFHL